MFLNHLEKPKPYSLHDLLKMKSGDVIGGFTTDDNGNLVISSTWQDVDVVEGSIVKRLCLFEAACDFKHICDWQKVGNALVATPAREQIINHLETIVRRGRAQYMGNVLFRTGYPVGVFLGYLFRDDGHTYAHVLTLDGYSVWI